MLNAKIRYKLFKYLNLSFLKISDDKLIIFAFSKISYKDKRQMFFLCYIYTNIYTVISKQRLGRKHKALQGIVIEHFVFLCLSPSQKRMESTLGNAFFSALEIHNFKFFSPLSAHHPGASAVTKYVTNGKLKKPLGTALNLPYFFISDAS